jgi:hypothetical protein
LGHLHVRIIEMILQPTFIKFILCHNLPTFVDHFPCLCSTRQKESTGNIVIPTQIRPKTLFYSPNALSSSP